MELTLYQVDAFTKELFKGNPAAVCPLDNGWLPDQLMQAIAMENNLSETAFFFRSGHDFQLRWFTPAKEVQLCGHATLATAHVLYEHLGFDQPRITFHTLSGPLMVTRNGDWYTMNFPVDRARLVPTPKAISAALGLPIVETYIGREDYLVILESQRAVESANPDFRQFRKLESRGVIISAPGENADFASRCFYPSLGVDEDPVTGSAHTTLAPYWSQRLNKTELTAIQCSSRSGALRLRMLSERVEIGGQAITFSEGRIRL